MGRIGIVGKRCNVPACDCGRSSEDGRGAGRGGNISTSIMETIRECWGHFKNTTKVGKGVPMGDYFYIENEWLIEQKLINNVPSITLSVKVRMVFIKRTMLQSIITNNVIAETKRWFDGYKTIIVKELSSATVAAQ